VTEKWSSAAPDISESDQVLMNSAGGRATIAAVKQHVAQSAVIQPQMNLEIDLGLDSLARAECFVSVEQCLGIELKAEEAATVQTVAELADLANTKLGTGHASGELAPAKFSWREALAQPDLQEQLPKEVKELLRPKPGSVLLAYAALRVVYLISRVLFRMQVRGGRIETTDRSGCPGWNLSDLATLLVALPPCKNKHQFRKAYRSSGSDGGCNRRTLLREADRCSTATNSATAG
jgi:acyl carrier protein